MAWMLKRLNSLAFVVALTVSGTAGASSLDLNLSDEAAELRYETSIGLPNMVTEAAWLHEQNHGDIVSAGIYAKDDALPGSQVLTIAVGARVFIMDTVEGEILAPGSTPGAVNDNPDGSGVAVGGRFRYTIPRMDRLGISGELYIAPSVVSGGDLDGFRQWAIRGEYQILRQANVYLGYRRVEPDFGGGSVDFESGIHAGLRLNF